MFGVIGTGIGAIVGNHYKTDRWEAVPLLQTRAYGDQRPSPPISSYIAFGARSTPFGHVTAP